MTLSQKVEKFLQVDSLVCANDSKKLGPPWGYLKLAMWPQYPLGSWKWLKQLLTGDTMVIRFCDNKCFAEFAGNQRLTEIGEHIQKAL